LLEGNDPVVGVVTQPDQPAGRGMPVHAPPVKVLAQARGVPVFQPAKLRVPGILDDLKAWNPDLIVVAAYGKMLPSNLLALPSYGCINVHASLLPKYRGAAPIQWAIVTGEDKTGVTIMKISERMDAGDILLQKSISIAPDETGGSLHNKLATLGADTLRESLVLLKQGELVAEPQEESQATYAPLIKKEDGRIDWRQDAASIERRIRAFHPWPSAFTFLGGKLLKIFSAQISTHAPLLATPGTVAEVSSTNLLVVTGAGLLALREVQLEGKKRLPIAEFLKGYHLPQGALLG
jgi:methionyl-tRNA formyltransferase